MKRIAVYNEKWHNAVENVFKKCFSEEDDFLGLSPDNTLGDLASILVEVYCKTIIGEEYMDMTLGEFMQLPEDELDEKLEAIFNLDKRGFTETYEPVV